MRDEHTEGPSLLHAVRAWRGVPTTSAGAELAIVITVVGWRVGTLLQLLPAAHVGIVSSPRPWLYATLLAVVVVESLLLCWFALRAREFRSTRWASVDVALAATLLLAQPLYVPDEVFIGSWVAWAPGFAVNAAVVGALGHRRLWPAILSAVVLGVSYLAVTWSRAVDQGALLTVGVNTFSYAVFTIIPRLLGDFLRRFGRDADAARAVAVESARLAENARHRTLLHDQAALLRLLSDPNVDQRLAGPLRRQARSESNRLRKFLESGSAPDGSTGVVLKGLNEAILDAARGFEDLPLTLALDLGEGVVLGERRAEAVRTAVTTALHNVRIHAGDVSQVVVHSDVSPAGAWEITVRDDGQGFDRASTPEGFGISRVIGEGLDAEGVRGQVESRPGRGTVVTMSGDVE